MVGKAYSYLRFSSTEQRKGNSFDRQIKGRDAFVTRKGLTLDSSLILEDAGVSAFRGMNAATGALRAMFTPFAGFTGQLAVQLVDVNGDGLLDVIARATINGKKRTRTFIT